MTDPMGGASQLLMTLEQVKYTRGQPAGVWEEQPLLPVIPCGILHGKPPAVTWDVLWIKDYSK